MYGQYLKKLAFGQNYLKAHDICQQESCLYSSLCATQA